MNEKRRLSAVDILLLVAMVLPILGCIVLQILCKPASEGISVSGAYIYLTIDMPLQPLYITEAQVNSWAVLLTIFFLCLFLTRNLSVRHPSVRQHLAEWIVKTSEGLVKDNMDPYFHFYGPFITTIIAISAFSSLISLVGLFPPTTDLNVVAGWAILVFIIITYYKFKCGPLYYAKGLCEPAFFLAPINLIGEFATVSLLDLHPPRIFQIDGNMGGTACVCEMLMQSRRGELRLLPALPKAWPKGSVKNFCAQDGVVASFSWELGQADSMGISMPSRATRPQPRDAVPTARMRPKPLPRGWGSS